MPSNGRIRHVSQGLRTLARLGLGLLICWQLFYLAVTNIKETCTTIFPDETEQCIGEDEASRSRFQHSLNRVLVTAQRWEELAEQPQRWSLFAPDINEQTSFLACEFRWDQDADQVVWLFSKDEPVDTNRYFRVGRNRVRSVEQGLALTFSLYRGESEQAARERWHYQIKRKVAYEYGGMITWANQRMQELRAQNQDAVFPDEVLIHLRGYELAPPEANSRDVGAPYSIPLARWRPHFAYPEEVLPIEAYNPTAGRFEFQTWDEEID